MQIMIKTLAILALLIMIVSCSSGPFPITSPYYKIPAGTKIIVHKKITIPANEARVYFQGGKVIPGRPDKYNAHCWFLSWNVSANEQTIEPGVFTVTHSQTYDDYVIKKSEIQLAASTHVIGMNVMARGPTGFSSSDAPSAIERTTTLKIHSDKQPGIREFSCNYWDAYLDGDPLTVAQMQQAVGSLVEIKTR